MPDTNVAKIRKVEPPAIYKTKRGKERLMGGRWNMLRVSEFLQSGDTGLRWTTLRGLFTAALARHSAITSASIFRRNAATCSIRIPQLSRIMARAAGSCASRFTINTSKRIK